MRTARSAQRGMSLVEALVAFAISSVGLLAMVGTQTALRQSGDTVRQRAEAVRLAQGEMERLRALAPAELAGATDTTSATQQSNTRFVIERTVAPQPDAAYVAASVRVRWTDRRGESASLGLDSVIAAIDPVLSGRLFTPAAASAYTAPLGRSAAIPLQATDLGDGRSAFTPPGAAGFVWVFNNQSGQVTDICAVPPGTTVSAATLTQCSTTHALLLSGAVRFATGATASAADAERPGSAALNLDMQLTLRHADGTPTSATCVDDAAGATTRSVVAYHCLVTVSAGSPGWSGRLDVLPIGWTVGADAAAYRVCRYSADHDGNHHVSNEEHPLDYTQVHGPLTHQNFLVIRGGNACPADVPADPARGDMVNSNTVEHAPRATPTPAA
ncbi:prepilin-type N-terminal cleavage/methylation domain-containing protein [Ideonella sp. BN130291]|uniref:prepilin-type N-terminal cleavage/methylation domain-containing protein n=1 Tax=Ideonella sp. BN130291 TaxID=3112940 RepID=UPI002E270BAC|nr:prepilin-type N-terminal cleavage/methylation domain-containing protein [Ideonella sp. BN130291]